MVLVGAHEQDLADVAERVASEAAELVHAAHERMVAGAPVRVDTKTSDTDVVTGIDHDSEQFIRRRLAELRPADTVVGEEAGGASGDDVTWVVDPIDGTVNFLYGFPWFAVSVAAQRNQEPIAGAVVEPISGRRWTAARGCGASLDGRTLRVSGPTRLDLALVSTGFAYRPDRRTRQGRFAAALLERVRDIRRTGAASLDLCSVAAGWTDGYIEHGLAWWDWAAGALIAEEAGATVVTPGQDKDLGADATFAAASSIATDLRAAVVTSDAGAV